MMLDIVVSLVLLLVGISVLVAIHVCIVGRVFSSSRRSNPIIVVETDALSTRPSMSQDEIKRLPSFVYNHNKGEDQTQRGNSSSRTDQAADCAVCLENFKVGEVCRLLPNCKHVFHPECIDSWLSTTAACPTCRTFVPDSVVNIGTGGDQQCNNNTGEVLIRGDELV